MLVRTILLPSIFRVNSEKLIPDYGLIIRFLQDLEKNGIVLVDDLDYILAAIREDIKEWPQKFKTQAQKLLIALRKKGRFIEMSLNDEVQVKCKNQQCQQCIRMAKIHLPPAIISSDHCKECVAKDLTQFPTIEVVDITDYSISDFFDAHLKPNDYFFGKGKLKQEFENKVLIPLLRDAKDVKIYDRYIGRSILQKANAPKYKCTLEWIIKVFMRERGAKFKGVFEVYGGISNSQISEKEIPDAIAALRKLEAEFQQLHPNFQLIIKKETKDFQMPHDRFLFTNQIAVSVGCGFNLIFDSPNLLQDVTISYFSKPGEIENAVKVLPNL
jgi:hypothetical protein